MKKIFIGFLSLRSSCSFRAGRGAVSHGNRCWRQHVAQRRVHEPQQRLGRQHVAYRRGGHLSYQCLRRQHVARYGEGTSHTNTYGGSASHAEGGGWSKTGAYGGTAYGDAHNGGAYYHPPAAATPAYHPPATVNYYGSGCYNCGGWATAGAAAAGAAVGVVAGASAASANTAAATSSAYSAGVAAGSAGRPTYVMGAIYGTLPAGCPSPTSAARPTTCAAIHGSSRPMARTASTTGWCPLPDHHDQVGHNKS